MRTVLTTTLALSLGLLGSMAMGQATNPSPPAPADLERAIAQPATEPTAAEQRLDERLDNQAEPQTGRQPPVQQRDETLPDKQEQRRDAADTRPLADANRAAADPNQWRYVRHNGLWWYWTPKNDWIIYSGGSWIPLAQFNARFNFNSQLYSPFNSYPNSYRTGYRGYDDGYYGTGYYNNGFYGPGAGNGRGYYSGGYYGGGSGYGSGYGPGYYYPGPATGASIGGAMGGGSGIGFGAGLGGAIGGR